MGCSGIGISRDNVLFVVSETTCGAGGTITGADAVLVTGLPNFKQEREFAKDNQKRPTNSLFPKKAISYMPGEYSFDTYIKPVSLGVAPAPDKMLAANFGTETIVGGASVTYTLGAITDAVPTVLIVERKSNITYWNFGCTVDAVYPINTTGDDSTGSATFSGQFLRQKRAGTSSVNNVAGYSSTDTVIKVDDVKEYQDETRIKFENAAGGWEDNSGVGYLIASVQVAADTITLSTGLLAAIADDAVVTGWTPTPVEKGVLVTGRLGTANIGGTNTVIANATVELKNNFKIINDEKASDEYPVTIVRSGDREVNVSFQKILTADNGDAYYDAEQQTTIDVKLPVGDTAGERYEFNTPITKYNTPDISGDEELRMDITGEGYASTSYDDELTLTLI